MQMNSFSLSPSPVVTFTSGSVKRSMTDDVDLSQDESTSGSVKRSMTDVVDLTHDESTSSSEPSHQHNDSDESTFSLEPKAKRKKKRNKSVSQNFNPTSFDSGIKELIDLKGANFKPRKITMRSTRRMSLKIKDSSYLHTLKFMSKKVSSFH